MLPPDSRAVLVQELKPPAGYRLDAAIATTFTLDLTAALIPALALSSYTSPGATPDPVSALNAIRQTVERLDIFCQAGNIGVPKQAPDLAAFLEPMVHQVKAPPAGLFHPKVWLVHYEHDDLGPLVKLLVLSRNLTHDNTWDIFVGLESERVGDEQYAANDPLRDFVLSLADSTVNPVSADRKDRLARLAAVAHRTTWALPEGVNKVGFHLLAPGRTTPTLSSRRQLVISPFVNDRGLELIAGTDSVQTIVVSRAEELEKLSPTSVAAIDAYVLDSVAGLSEDDGGEQFGTLGALHAKAYVLETDGQRKPRVLLGSANATSAAFSSNVEFLVEFVGAWNTFGIDALLGSEEGPTPFRAMLDEYKPSGGAQPSANDEAKWQLENQLRRVATIQHMATVRALDDGRYELSVRAANYRLASRYQATIRPLTRPGTDLKIDPDGDLAERFRELAKAEITGFFAVAIRDLDADIEGSCVVLASLDGDPDDRLEAVIAAQLDTPEKFIRFLHLLISLGDPTTADLASAVGGLDGFFGDPAHGGGVLELLLRGFASNPAVISEIDRVVTALAQQGTAVLPDGFAELWPVVLEAQSLLTEVES